MLWFLLDLLRGRYSYYNYDVVSPFKGYDHFYRLFNRLFYYSYRLEYKRKSFGLVLENVCWPIRSSLDYYGEYVYTGGGAGWRKKIGIKILKVADFQI